MKVLPDTISIYDLTKESSETIEVMKSLGFTDIVKPGMLQIAGKIMTLKKGCEFKKINYEEAKKRFLEIGIDFKET
jgi:hypothetical protein